MASLSRKLNFLLFFFAAACTTIAKREPCVFPFIYDGVEYDKCTSTDAEGVITNFTIGRDEQRRC